MNLKYNIPVNLKFEIPKKNLFVCALLVFSGMLNGQQSPLYPASYRITTPFVLNPAIAGSKDFTSIDCSATLQGDNKSQVFSGHTRLAKTTPGYFNYPEVKSYTNIGVGGALYNDNLGNSHTTGFSAMISYQLPLNKNKLSFLSVGLSAKGIYNRLDSVTDLGVPTKLTFFPNMDFGIYYYNPSFYAGISSTNILGNPLDSVEMSTYKMPVSRQYYFIGGYKIVLSRSLNIVFEPSVIVNLSDTIKNEYTEVIEPILKLYLDNLCVGTYIYNYNNLSFFFQYKFPRFYLGAFVDFPRDTPFYKKELGIELMLGLNLSSLKPTLLENWHW